MSLTRVRFSRKQNDRAVLPVWSLLHAVILLLAAPACASTDEASVILAEDFESYPDTASMRMVWKEGTSELVSEVPGGGKAAVNLGGARNACSGFSVSLGDGQTLAFSADLYDYATNIDKRVTVALRNQNGAYVEFGHVNKLGPYGLRLVGFGTTENWLSFDPLLQPTPGWHRYEAAISPTNIIVGLDLGADGSIDRTMNFASTTPKSPFSNVRFGGLTGRESQGGPVLIDNIRITVTPGTEAGNPVSTGASETNSSGSNPEYVSEKKSPVSGRSSDSAMTSANRLQREQVGVIRDGASAEWWIVGALGIIIVLMTALLLMFRRVTRAARPLALPWSATAALPAAIGAVSSDREQALRGSIPPELVEFAKLGLIQGLYTHRNTLIEVQKRALQEIAELEGRLASLQLPLHERIRAFEDRIVELEKELGTRDDEMRELTQATLLLVREKLEKEKEMENERIGRQFN